MLENVVYVTLVVANMEAVHLPAGNVVQEEAVHPGGAAAALEDVFRREALAAMTVHIAKPGKSVFDEVTRWAVAAILLAVVKANIKRASNMSTSQFTFQILSPNTESRLWEMHMRLK